MKQRTLVALLIIIVLSFLLRFWGVGKNPSILNRDEAALGYNAFLLKELGVDEWNRSWPLALESFGDFKLIGYPASLVVFFSVFGVNDLVVRLPSVIAGTLLVLTAYYYARFLKLDEKFSLLSAVSISLAPFAIFYSRMAYEANLALTFFSVSVLLLFNRKKIVTDLIALLLLSISTLTYNTPLLLTPFVLIILVIYRGITKWKEWILPFLLGVFLCQVMFIQLGPLTAQKSSITIFNDELVREQSIAYRQQIPTVLRPVLGNKYVYFSGIILKNIILSFSPKFLVTAGGQHPWHSLPDWGHIYLPIYVLSLFAVVMTLLQLLGRVTYYFLEQNLKLLYLQPLSQSFTGKRISLLLLLFISLAPSIATVDSPHATRSLFFLFLLHIFAILGLYDLLVVLHNNYKTQYFWRLLEAYLIPMTAAILLFFSLSYIYDYQVIYPRKQNFILKSGFEEVIKQVENDNSTSNVAVVDTEGYHYILTAWYLQTPPEEYLDTVVRQLPSQIGFRYGERVGKYHFIADRDDRSEDEKTLIYFDDNRWQVETF